MEKQNAFLFAIIYVLAIWCSISCQGVPPQSSTDSGADTDTDSDTDADTDTDTDSDWEPPTADDFGNGTLMWAVRYGNPTIAETIDLTVLDDDSVISPCNHSGETIFGVDEPNETLIEDRGLALARWDSNGALLWAKNIATAQRVGSGSIASSSDGNVYFAGGFCDLAVFGPGESGETTLTAHGNSDGFFASTNEDGDLQWVRQVGGVDDDHSWKVGAAGDGGVLVLGSFLTQAELDTGTGGTMTLNGVVGEQNLFLARYSVSGELEWVRVAGAIPDYYFLIPLKLAVASDGSAFIAFSREYLELVLGEGEANETVFPATATGKTVMARFQPDGDLEWAKMLDGMNSGLGEKFSLSVVPDGSSVFVVSDFEGTTTFGPGDPGQTTLSCEAEYGCGVLARYDENGSLEWAVGIDGGEYSSLGDVDVVDGNSVAVTGSFSGEIYLCSTAGEGYSLPPRGDFEILTAKYDMDGVLIWAEQAGSPSAFWEENGNATAGDSKGAVLVTGSYSSTAWFGILEPMETYLDTFTGSGEDRYDVFLAKYEP